jgi:hypothetical protein
MPYKDKNKQKEFQKKHYQDNKKKYYACSRSRRLNLANKLSEYKSHLSCLYCGKKHPACIDFHHNGDEQKIDTVVNILVNTKSWDKVINEIKKCDAVCANCHRKLHKREKKNQRYLEDTSNVGMQHKREIIRWFYDYKSALKCEVCGENEPCCIDFHHEREKTMSIGRFASRGHSKDKILEEIKKCKVLCANCHRELHWNERLF